MILSTHGILASSGSSIINNDSGYLFKSTTNSTIITGTTSNTISYSILIPANTMLVGDFFQYTVNIIRVGLNATSNARVYFNTSASLTGATLSGSYTMSTSFLSVFFSKITPIKTATNTEFNVTTVATVTRDAVFNSPPSASNINWTVDQYFIIAFQPGSVLDSFYVNGLFFLKT